LKGNARKFYYNVLFAYYRCPKCRGRLTPEKPSEGLCTACGYRLDPTLHFQMSACCQASLVRRRLHYSCKACGAMVPSRFLFDERLFDNAYFRERVAASRERRNRAIETMQLRLMAARTPPLFLTSLPEPDDVKGLSDALDALVLRSCFEESEHHIRTDSFCMDEYRTLVLTHVRECILHFDAIPCICSDLRADRARRFTALVFMEHEREVALEQKGEDILVRAYAPDAKG
ncbi:MAG: hypothetical protein K8F62_10940, partial [Pseudorhodoplanes sp.]|nr:hypothetical protein [Pseudorhodoplanes sp.]